MKDKSLNNIKKYTISFLILFVLILSFIASLTFAYLSDTHSADIVIRLADINNSATSSQELTPSDLTPDNIFSKTLSVEIDSSKEIYIRSYAIITMQTMNNGVMEERTDLVDLIGVSLSSKGDDNKYYYTNNTENLAELTTSTISLEFTFYVSSNVSSNLFLNANGTRNNSLKTTIKYYFEYCQIEAVSEWSEKGTGV